MLGKTPKKWKPHFNCSEKELDNCLKVVNTLIFAYKNAEDTNKIKVLEDIYTDILQDFKEDEEEIIEPPKKPKLVNVKIRRIRHLTK